MDKKVVVLIDSGINKLDFCDCLVGGKHFYVEENYVCCDDSFDDDNGHGSACAYTIKSIFPETQFYIIKILDQNLETVYPVLEAALEHCMDLKYHIINLSLSLLEEVGSVNLKLICDALQKKGKIIVASVSNGHRQSFPAAYPSVIGVRGSFFSSSEEYWYNSKEDIQCIADISPTFTSWTLDNYFMFIRENIIFRIIQQFQGEVSAEPISIINAIAIVIGGCLFVSAISMTISTIFSNVYIGYGFSGIFWLYWNINCQTESIINPFPFIANPTFYEKHLVLIYIITVGLILVNCFLCTRSPFYFGDKIRKCFYR